MRRISLFFFCIGVVTMSCEDGGSTEDGGPTLCNANETYHQASNTCKCDTSNHWEGEAGACTCANGYIEFFGQCVTSAETTCDAVKEVYDSASNTCKCDTSNHWEGEAGSCKCNSDYEESSGQCVLKQNNTCDAVKEVYDSASKTCKCDTSKHFEGEAGSCKCRSGDVEISGQCVTSAETTCDAVKEIYDRASNTCKCDTSNHWEGEAGSCTCRSGDVEISGQCVTSAEATCDAVKEVYDSASNTCKCDTSKFFEGEAGSCICAKDNDKDYVLIGNTCEEKQTCRKDQVYVEADNTCVCQQWFMEQDGECVEYCLGDKEVRGEDGKCSCSDDYVRLESRCIAPSSCVSDKATWNPTLHTHQCDEGTQLFLGCCQVLAVGETVTFGSYPQDEDSDTPSPLTWQILDIKDDAVLLISKYVLEQYQYHDEWDDITWEKSNVRSYLNGLGAAHNNSGIDHDGEGFIDKAFTAEERQCIKQVTNINPDAPEEWNNTPGGNDTADKVFLLSHDEVLQYLPTHKSRVAHPTAYAIHPPEGSGRNNLYTCKVTCLSDNICRASSCSDNGTNVQACSDAQCCSRWWLRSPGLHPYYAALVHVGSVYNFNVNYDLPGLRPALYVRLNL